MNPNLILAPSPKELAMHTGVFRLTSGVTIYIPEEEKETIFFTASRLQKLLRSLAGIHAEIMIEAPEPPEEPSIRLIKQADYSAERYGLSIERNSLNISFGTCAGAFHAVSTLKQILKQCGKMLPCLSIEDEPDFAARGIMLDVSRNKIPAMESLFQFVDFMSDYKFNQLQLYIEGFSFAYRSFPDTWKNQTPITGEEIMRLDRYCKERFIELVPNQNSFGHMGAWTSREEFSHLAEFSKEDNPFGQSWSAGTLNPVDPGTIELLGRTYDDLLPYFTSGMCNVGCDETEDLGKARSKEECEKRGTGRVYLDFLLELRKLLMKRGKRMMFWGDIIMHYPELIPALPSDMIALEWGYESHHPFDADGLRFHEAGIEFHVCPGTSSWDSIAGRTENMRGNLVNAAVNGKKHGASGYLITDWGDSGHHQYLPSSYGGFIYGAGLSWNVENNLDMDIAAVMDRFIFEDRAGIAGKCFLELGDSYLIEPRRYHNRTCMADFLYSSVYSDNQLEGFNEEILDRIINYAENLSDTFEGAQMAAEDRFLVEGEFKNAVRMTIHGAKVGRLKLLLQSAASDPVRVKALCRELTNDIAEIITEHRKLWLSRNRPGGLENSVGVLENLREQYRKVGEQLQAP